MGDRPSRLEPPSPISMLLQNMGLTRDDLAQRAEQMRNFLDTDQNSLRALSQQSDSHDSAPTRARRRSRTGSASIASSQLQSPSPSPTNVKSEPVDKPIPPSSQMDTMHIVMERKRRQMKRDRKGSSPLLPFSLSLPIPRALSPCPAFQPRAHTPSDPTLTLKPYRFYRTVA